MSATRMTEREYWAMRRREAKRARAQFEKAREWYFGNILHTAHRIGRDFEAYKLRLNWMQTRFLTIQ